ncbi:MAG: hypothetical protein ACM3TU_01705 [Bacillota bacterium]
MSNRTHSRGRSQALVIPSMPDQTIATLMYLAGAIFAIYIVLVIVTISLATMQTSLAAQVRSREGAIAQLERDYYAAIAKQNETSPASVGLVHPAVVQYAVAKPAQGLTFAGN